MSMQPDENRTVKQIDDEKDTCYVFEPSRVRLVRRAVFSQFPDIRAKDETAAGMRLFVSELTCDGV